MAEGPTSRPSSPTRWSRSPPRGLRAPAVDAGNPARVVGAGLPDDPDAYHCAGATWWLATGWLDQLDEAIERGTPISA